MMDRQRWLMIFAVVVVLAMAIGFRLAGIGWSLPFLFHPDEPNYLRIVLRMMQTGDLNPHVFDYPSLFYYLSLVALVPYYLVGAALGIFHSPLSALGPQIVGLGVASVPFPAVVWLPRFVMALAGILTVLAVFGIVIKRSQSLIVAVVAASILAFSPASIIAAHFFRPDTLAALFALLAVYSATRMLQVPRLRMYLLAGAMSGLAIAAKYNVWPVILSIIVGHIFVPRSQRHFRNLIAAGIACIGATFIASPFVILDLPKALAATGIDIWRYFTLGHAGSEGTPSLVWYLTILLKEEPALTILGTAGFIIGVRRRDRATWISLAFSAVYFAQFAAAIVYTRLALVPLLPLLAVESASAIDFVRSLFFRRPMMRWFATAGVITLLLIQLTQAVRATQIFTLTDVQTVAGQWIVDKLPQGSRIALEGYTPLLSSTDYQVLYVNRMIEHPLEWYMAQGYDYLVLSDAIYGRYDSDPVKYRQEIAAYRPFLEDLPLVQEIQGPYPFKGEAEGTIRVYALQK